MPESEIITGSDSPFGNARSLVETDGRVVFLYMAFLEEGQEEPPPDELKACWVRNLFPAPDENDIDAMEDGLAPMMPLQGCQYPQGQPPLNEDDLRLVWFEEGTGIALLEKDEILAIIPPWWGIEDCPGYARDCSSPNLLAWPLEKDNVLLERVRRAEEYWNLWDDESFWDKYSTRLIKVFEAAFGKHTKYYAIDGGEWPPKALLRFDLPDRYLLVTVGVSLLPQPGAEMATEDPSDIRRIELAVSVDKSCSVDEVKRLGTFISGHSQYPWAEQTWLGVGHTVTCDSTPKSCDGKKFPAALLTTRLSGTPDIKMPKFRGDPINLLWFYPITSAELEYARANSTDQLIDLLIKAGHDVTIRPRRELSL